jgi:hypothetical protein
VGVSAPGERVQAEAVLDTREVLEGVSGSYGAVSTRVDAEGNTFHAYISSNPRNTNDVWVHLRRYARDGRRTGEWIIEPVAGFKADGVALEYSGRDVLVVQTTHTYSLPRTRQVEVAVVRGVFNPPPGGPEAYVPDPRQVGDVDYARIQGMIDAATRREADRVLAGVSALVRAELVRQGVLTTDNVYSSYGLYRRILETTYEAAGNALEEWNPCETRTPTPVVMMRVTATPLSLPTPTPTNVAGPGK